MIDPNSASLARETRSSIELSRDAKGVYRWDIKLYFDAGLIDAYNEPDGETPRAMRLLRSIDERLRAVFNPDPSSEEAI